MLGVAAGSEISLPLLRSVLLSFSRRIFKHKRFYRTFSPNPGLGVNPEGAFQISFFRVKYPGLPLQHGTGVCACGHRGVFGKAAGGDIWFSRLPFFLAGREFLGRQFHVHLVVGYVDFDYVTFFQQSDWPADRGFGADVADAGAACAAAEPAVGDEGD